MSASSRCPARTRSRARPHWAKTIPGNTPKLAELYGDDALCWEAIRKTFDPEGLFLNAWYHRHIGFAPASLPEQEERDARAHATAEAWQRS